MTNRVRHAGYDEQQIDYIYDSRGLFIYRSFLSDEEIAAAKNCCGSLSFMPEVWAPEQLRASDIANRPDYLGELNVRLRDHGITHRLVGYPARLLESYALDRKCGRLDLHGGASEFLVGGETIDISAKSWVQHQRLYSLRLKVIIYLDDVLDQNAGRFLYIEGSHKASFSFHRAFRGGRSTAHELTRTLELRAGDAIWLNEALLHGAESKISQGRRRLLAYSYGPAFMSNWVELGATSASQDKGYFPVETEQGSDG